MLLLVAIRGPFFKTEKLSSIEIKEPDLNLSTQIVINYYRACHGRTVC